MRHIGLFIAFLLLASSAFASPEIGKKAPNFTLQDASGKSHKLSDYQGKVVVLEWTCPKCPYVQRHYKEDTMESLSAALPDSNVVWLAVNTSHFTKREDVVAWSKDQNLGYPTLLDGDGAVGRLYNAKTTPHMFVIDASGTLAYNGAIDDDIRGAKGIDQRVNYVAGAVQATLIGEKVLVAETKPYGCSVKYGQD
ncbi:MAG: redoxin domain-containing protein [Candidatus Latescibacterota bacterium]|jgi:peroxiredoxin